MPEEKKKERTVAEIQGEYSQLCTRVGHIQYNIFALEKDLSALNETLRDLNFEAAAANNREKAAAAAADAQPKEEVKASE